MSARGDVFGADVATECPETGCPEAAPVTSFGYYFRVSRSPLSARAAMSQDPPVGCLLMVIVPLLLIVSTYLAWWELRFLIQGRTTLATVDGVQKVRLSRHLIFFGGSYLEVRYSFKDEPVDRLRAEHDELPLSRPQPEGTVRIQYVSGVPGGSRLEGHRHVIWSIFFAICVTGSLVSVGFLLKDARRAVHEEEDFEASRRRNAGT
jgi:hypothetical protein